MSTQDTTLPPLPEPAMKASEGVCCGNYSGGAYYMGQQETICCGQPDEAWPDYFTTDQMHAYARAAIAAQAPQPSPLIAVGEDGEGQENHCPECGAEPGQMCSDEEGTEHGRKVHAVRQAQQAQGVPEAFPAEIWGLLAEVADRKGTEYTSPWEGPDGEPLQDAADAAIAWILSRAAAPQAEPQTPAKFLSPNGELVIDALRTAMDKASVPRDFRAVLIGYFCNGWNEIIRRAAAEPQPEREPSEWRKAVQEAYGWLWHINNEPMAPVPLLSEGKAAYQARKALRELLTSAERGEAINAVREQAHGIGTKGGDKP